MKYEFKCVDTYGSGFEAIVRSEEVMLTDLLVHFEYFLKACGFVIDGKHLEIVPDDDSYGVSWGEDEDTGCPGCASATCTDETQQFLDDNQDLMDTLAKHEAESDDETLQQVRQDETT